jgi:serine O-acetyltransferase
MHNTAFLSSQQMDVDALVISTSKNSEENVEPVTTSQVSATQPDWSRERCRCWWDPSRQLLKSIRKYQKWKAYGGILGRFFKAYNVIQHRFWSVVTGADIPLNCNIQGGLMLPHPNGVVIHPTASIGPNCMIFQQVTLVAEIKVGGHVDIGTGAKILDAVTIGDHAKIGANAVVLCDVPEGATAVGVPAKIVKSKTDQARSSESIHSKN